MQIFPVKERVFIAISSLLVVSFAANAQDAQVRVDLGSVSLTMGSEEENLVLLPLSLLAGPETGIVKVETTIWLPTAYLSFTRSVARSERVKVETQTSQDPEDIEKSRLIVVVSAADSGQSIPSGVIADLEFNISPYAPTGTIELAHAPKAYTASHLLDNVEGQSGSIEVDSPPIFTCFFYMH